MVVPRGLCVLAGLMTGLGAALWLGAIAPLAGVIGASWGALTIVHALAAAATAALALLVTAAGALLAADLRAEVQSCQAWAQINVAPAEVSLPVVAVTRGDLDPRYLPTMDNEVLQRVFQARRFSAWVPMLCSTERLDGTERISAWAGGTSQDDLIGQAAQAVPRTLPAAATITAASHRRAPGAGHAAARARLVVNASAWPAWPGAECILSPTAAQRRTADIIVLGSRQVDQARPLPEGSAGSNISSSTEPPSCRGPPQAGHRSCAGRTAPAKLSPERAPHVPAPTDPIVGDNLGDQVPVCAAELDVIETYLDHVLLDLLASSAGGSEQEQT